MQIHAEHDLLAGQPFCADCYDYDAHVIWQWWAPELWRRFTIAVPRLIAKWLDVTQRQARKLVRVSFAKVGEYQARGVFRRTHTCRSETCQRRPCDNSCDNEASYRPRQLGCIAVQGEV